VHASHPHSEKASEIQYRKTILQEVGKKLLLSLEGDEKVKKKSRLITNFWGANRRNRQTICWFFV
jgi:hypothetical protein